MIQVSDKNLQTAPRISRTDLYSVDSMGRRRRIDTAHLSDRAYRSLLEACERPVHVRPQAPTRAVHPGKAPPPAPFPRAAQR